MRFGVIIGSAVLGLMTIIFNNHFGLSEWNWISPFAVFGFLTIVIPGIIKQDPFYYFRGKSQ